MSSRLLHCYAEGVNGEWEAICLDFDIAVQGASFEEVSASLRTAITLYLQSVADLPEGERAALLERTASLRVRVKFLAYTIRELLVAGTHHDESRLAAHHALVHAMAAALPVEFVPTGGENAEEVAELHIPTCTLAPVFCGNDGSSEHENRRRSSLPTTPSAANQASSD